MIFLFLWITILSFACYLHAYGAMSEQDSVERSYQYRAATLRNNSIHMGLILIRHIHHNDQAGFGMPSRHATLRRSGLNPRLEPATRRGAKELLCVL